MKQLSLFQEKREITFGGSLLKGRRKSKRPLARKRAHHVTLYSNEVLKCGSFLRHRFLIAFLMVKYAAHFDVDIYTWSVNSNHLHFVFKFSETAAFKNFMRVFTGQIAQRIQGCRPKKPTAPQRPFFLVRPFTRILTWGRDFRKVKEYVWQNTLEALGIVEYQARKTRHQPNTS